MKGSKRFVKVLKASMKLRGRLVDVEVWEKVAAEISYFVARRFLIKKIAARRESASRIPGIRIPRHMSDDTMSRNHGAPVLSLWPGRKKYGICV